MTIPERIDAYLAGPEQLRHAIAGLTPEQLDARPVAGKWSVRELVAHLADFEPILADRMLRIAALDRPLLMGADERQFAARLGYAERDLDEELALVDAVRRRTARILRTLPADAYARVGIHSERGALTLEQVLTGATQHVLHHLPFIAEKRAALGV